MPFVDIPKALAQMLEPSVSLTFLSEAKQYTFCIVLLYINAIHLDELGPYQ